MPDLTNRVREKRQEAGMSQARLARLAEIGESNLSQIECGKHYAWPRARRSISQALGCSEAELFPPATGDETPRAGA